MNTHVRVDLHGAMIEVQLPSVAEGQRFPYVAHVTIAPPPSMTNCHQLELVGDQRDLTRLAYQLQRVLDVLGNPGGHGYSPQHSGIGFPDPAFSTGGGPVLPEVSSSDWDGLPGGEGQDSTD